MEHLTLGQVAVLGLVFGSTAAFGIMGALVARTAYTIHRGHRWPDVVRITDLGARK